MDLEAFTAELRKDGYLDIETKTIEADKVVGLHSHPFDVRAVVLDGSARIACGGEPEREFKAGDIVEVAAGVEHTEHYGPEGYKFLVGRRHPS